MEKILNKLLGFEKQFLNLLRISIFVVMAWIGGLKYFQYEADGIVAFVSNSPFMGFFYKNASNEVILENGDKVAEYTLYKNPEGKVIQKNIDWHQENGTYIFSYLLGVVIISIGILVLLGIWFPKVGFWGGFLTLGMSFVTLSFLVTTPEVLVPNLGGDFDSPNHGFPYLSAAGRLVLKDVIMLAASLVIMLDSAKSILNKK